jgi:hypothetical protein
MKDNDQSANLRALIDAGISSFKIEGRLKDLAYVKNITAHYRTLIDDILTEICRRTAAHRAAVAPSSSRRSRRSRSTAVRRITSSMAGSTASKPSSRRVSSVKRLARSRKSAPTISWSTRKATSITAMASAFTTAHAEVGLSHQPRRRQEAVPGRQPGRSDRRRDAVPQSRPGL